MNVVLDGLDALDARLLTLRHSDAVVDRATSRPPHLRPVDERWPGIRAVEDEDHRLPGRSQDRKLSRIEKGQAEAEDEDVEEEEESPAAKKKK